MNAWRTYVTCIRASRQLVLIPKYISNWGTALETQLELWVENYIPSTIMLFTGHLYTPKHHV
jgi:hypothetical protein